MFEVRRNVDIFKLAASAQSIYREVYVYMYLNIVVFQCVMSAIYYSIRVCILSQLISRTIVLKMINAINGRVQL